MLVNVVFAAAEAGAANPVTFDLWTLIFQSLNVLVVMGVLYFMLFKPVAGIMQKHEVEDAQDRKSTRLNSSHVKISYAVFCLKKKKRLKHNTQRTDARSRGLTGCCER